MNNGEVSLTEAERLEQLHEYPVGTTSSDAVMVPISLLRPAKKNPRRGAVADVIESLREFGQHRPVVVQYSTGTVTVGNHMLKAAIQLGWTEMSVLIVDDSDEVAMRRAIADNAVGDKAKWDEEELAEVMQEIGAVPGMNESDIDKLLSKLAPPPKIDEPTYPLVPRMNEKYDYVVIFCENETDWNWLQTRLELRREKSY
jgi:ParB-like chromosome segregation protein Spo0J